MKQKQAKDKEPKTSKIKKDRLAELQRQLKDLQSQKDEVFEKLQRVGADYANFQKRVPKQIADTVGYEREKIIRTLLPVLDNFQHTLQNAASADSVDVLAEAVRIIYDQMVDILKSHGVEHIEAVGEKFNPSLHEAMMRRSDPETGDDIVLEEFQTGYKLNDRVIRPAKVVVNKIDSGKEEQKEPSQADEPDLDIES